MTIVVVFVLMVAAMLLVAGAFAYTVHLLLTRDAGGTRFRHRDGHTHTGYRCASGCWAIEWEGRP